MLSTIVIFAIAFCFVLTLAAPSILHPGQRRRWSLGAFTVDLGPLQTAVGAVEAGTASVKAFIDNLQQLNKDAVAAAIQATKESDAAATAADVKAAQDAIDGVTATVTQDAANLAALIAAPPSPTARRR